MKGCNLSWPCLTRCSIIRYVLNSCSGKQKAFTLHENDVILAFESNRFARNNQNASGKALKVVGYVHKCDIGQFNHTDEFMLTDFLGFWS